MQHRGGLATCSATGSSRIYGATAVIGVTPQVRHGTVPCCLAVNQRRSGRHVFAVVQPTVPRKHR